LTVNISNQGLKRNISFVFFLPKILYTKYASTMASNSEIRLDFLYELQAKEFVIRFQSSSQAAAYQSKNNEARIFDDRRHDVWLPVSPGMKYLRSSSTGMAVVFESEAAARRWNARTILGELVVFEGKEHGVSFQRWWSPGKLKDKIGDLKSSLGPPSDIAPPNTRPSSSQGDRYNVVVGEQKGSRLER
jgi:hypothetical protein